VRMRQTLNGACLAGWIADCCAAAVRPHLDYSDTFLDGCDELDVDDFDDEFEEARFILAIVTPSEHGAVRPQHSPQVYGTSCVLVTVLSYVDLPL